MISDCLCPSNTTIYPTTDPIKIQRSSRRIRGSISPHARTGIFLLLSNWFKRDPRAFPTARAARTASCLAPPTQLLMDWSTNRIYFQICFKSMRVRDLRRVSAFFPRIFKILIFIILINLVYTWDSERAHPQQRRRASLDGHAQCRHARNCRRHNPITMAVHWRFYTIKSKGAGRGQWQC